MIVRKINTLLVVAILLIIWNCSPDEDIPIPENKVGTPVFSFSGQLDNEPVAFTAGVEEYYMEASYSIADSTSYDIPYFNTVFRQVNSEEPVQEQLLIRLKGVSTDISSGAFEIQNQFTTTQLQYLGTPVIVYDTTYQVIFENQSASSLSESAFQWESGESVNGSYAEYEPVIEFDQPQNFVMCLTSTYSLNTDESCQNTRCKTVAFEEALRSCEASLDFEMDTELTVTASVTGGSAPYTFDWGYGGVTDENLQLAPNSLGDFTVTVTDSEDCIDSVGFQTIPNAASLSLIEYCHADFSYEVVQAISSTPLPSEEGRVTIIYTDKAGKSYRSDLSQQPATSGFKILKIEDYEPNENGDPTIKLELSLNCHLFNPDGTVKVLSNGMAVIAVAYPE